MVQTRRRRPGRRGERAGFFFVTFLTAFLRKERASFGTERPKDIIRLAYFRSFGFTERRRGRYRAGRYWQEMSTAAIPAALERLIRPAVT